MVNYKGRGNHSVSGLEDIIEILQEENHQKQIRLQKQSARIRELEEVAEGMLFEVKRTISPELREKAENALRKTEQS